MLRLRPPARAKEPASRAAAWAVHAFTASGALLAVAALDAINRGDLRAAALYMLGALFIDAVDGTLARAAKVDVWIPRIDGRRLDDMVDYLNYVIVPVVFLIAAGILVTPLWAAVPVLASAYGFSQTNAKTDDDWFLGWPSYWNVVAIYAWLLGASAVVTTAFVTLFAVLVFVPIKYAYPSKMPVLRRPTLVLALFWLAAVAGACAWPELAARWRLPELSLVFPAWYMGVSLVKGGLERKRA